MGRWDSDVEEQTRGEEPRIDRAYDYKRSKKRERSRSPPGRIRENWQSDTVDTRLAEEPAGKGDRRRSPRPKPVSDRSREENLRWGKPGEEDDREHQDAEREEPEPEPDFGLSGALAAETNTVK